MNLLLDKPLQPGVRPVTSNLSQFFIHNILHGEKGGEKTGFDFSLEQIQYLCELEPEHCEDLLDSLSLSTAKQSISKNYDDTDRDKVGIGEIDMEDDEIATADIISNKDHFSYQAYINLPGPGRNIFQLLGLPRHILILGLIPFFPAMLLFTASGGAAFFVTTGVEFVLRWCSVEEVHRKQI